LRRARIPAKEAIERLVGMQGQNPLDPYVGLWSRLAGFQHADLSELIAARKAVRMTFLRGTVHLVTARDCLAFRPVLQAVLERVLYQSSPFGRRLEGMNIQALLQAGRALLDERPRSTAELGPLLHQRWPDRDAEALAQGVRYLLPLVQVPPRGLWGQSGQARHTTVETWLGRSLATRVAPDRLVLRYLAAFGPATAADVRAWSGLAGLREVLERVRPRLRTYRDERGRELFDLRDGVLPDPDTPAPPRFLPVYDNVVLAHADRSRVIDARRRWIGPEPTTQFGSVLIDGFVGATWTVTREARRATLNVSLLGRLSKQDRTAVAEEGERLVRFVAADAQARDVRIVPAR
jgi:hypothetical protein